MADKSIIRITKELADIQKNSDLSLAVACRDIDVRTVKALIIGPHETPYEFGFFEFALKFNRDYPGKPPSVNAVTTNQGRCRFNPNIYASGKVCLSILGTWRGERGEEWSAAQGLESILLSIQSLMSANPYENEPGFEDANEVSDKQNQRDYVQKIRHETIRISVIQRMEEYLGIDPGTEGSGSLAANDNVTDSDEEGDDADEANVPFEPFKDLCKRRFLWYYDSYIAAVQKGASEVKDSQNFTRMPFEGSSNQMDGKFHYAELEQRLRNIKQVLDAETLGWAKEGLKGKAADSTIGFNLKGQYQQVAEAFKAGGMPHNVELVNDNPYVWSVTYVGKPMTNLDGGLFHFKMYFSPRFPDEQPRIVFETKLFHHRISPDGTLCYFPNPSRREDVRSHIESVFEALEEENPPYDPRTIVNPEASKLYWGGPDDRRLYNRRLRKSVQESMDDF